MATYKIQIDGEVRNATPEEVARIDAQRAEAEAQTEAVKAKAAARQAVLNKLGLTADEAAALLG
jgi:ribosomal protein L9